MKHSNRAMTALLALPCAVLVLVSSPALGQHGESTPGVHQGQPQPSVEEFLDWCDDQLPETGNVIVLYERSDGGPSRLTVGLDAGSGAWFYATDRRCLGRTPGGAVFSGSVADGVGPEEDVVNKATPLGIGEFIPAAFLYYLLERPESIEDVRRTTAGWEVLFAYPFNGGRPPAQIEVDDSGRVTRWSWDLPGDLRVREFEYWTGGDAAFAIVSPVGTRGDRVVSEVRTTDDPAAVFSPTAVEAVMRDNHVQVETAISASRSGYRQSDSGDWVREEPVEPAPYGGSAIQRWRRPLVVAGCMFVALGVFEVWWRRR